MFSTNLILLSAMISFLKILFQIVISSKYARSSFETIIFPLELNFPPTYFSDTGISLILSLLTLSQEAMSASSETMASYNFRHKSLSCSSSLSENIIYWPLAISIPLFLPKPGNPWFSLE